MKIEELTIEIYRSLNDRFFIEDDYTTLKRFLELAENFKFQNEVMRIHRIPKENKLVRCKTILIAELKEISELKDVLHWTASVKDILLDPESSDLYLFVIFETDDITLEESLRIESTEQFCRKYVQRPNKTVNEFIERTFLSRINSTKQDAEHIDPLNNALLLTGKNNKWFTKEEQLKWKNLLLSNKTGYDLVELLIPKYKK